MTEQISAEALHTPFPHLIFHNFYNDEELDLIWEELNFYTKPDTLCFLIKKLFFSAIFNSCLFIVLFIGIQNSSNKSKVDFLINETIELPISFIVGSSFILGSIIGNFNIFNINKKK